MSVQTCMKFFKIILLLFFKSTATRSFKFKKNFTTKIFLLDDWKLIVLTNKNTTSLCFIISHKHAWQGTSVSLSLSSMASSPSMTHINISYCIPLYFFSTCLNLSLRIKYTRAFFLEDMHTCWSLVYGTDEPICLLGT